MNAYYIIKQLLKDGGHKMSEIPKGLGVSLQSVNRSLNGRISMERFVKIVEMTGYEVLIGKIGEDGKVYNIRKLEKIEKGEG